MRLTKKDWRLIKEALDMLLMDYDDDGPGAHPDHDRLEYLHDLAMERGQRKTLTHRPPNISKAARKSVLNSIKASKRTD